MAVSLPQLSARQERMIDFIRQFIRDRGYPPTVREIGQGVAISSTSVVDYNLNILERSGLLRRDREISRGIELLGEAAESPVTPFMTVPIVGLIAAGEPIEAVEGHQETIALSPDLAADGAFALRVKGKSMIEDLIDDGDLVVVRPEATADNGAIVVALLLNGPTGEGTATLKRIYRERTRIRLQPANSEMQPIYAAPEDVRVQGRVVSVIRQLS
jgi:repressor LexA